LTTPVDYRTGQSPGLEQARGVLLLPMKAAARDVRGDAPLTTASDDERVRRSRLLSLSSWAVLGGDVRRVRLVLGLATG
jgi:hypothetical protein